MQSLKSAICSCIFIKCLMAPWIHWKSIRISMAWGRSKVLPFAMKTVKLMAAMSYGRKFQTKERIRVSIWVLSCFAIYSALYLRIWLLKYPSHP